MPRLDLRIDQIRCRKKGAPTSAVRTPSFRSRSGAISRVATSAASRTAAPERCGGQQARRARRPAGAGYAAPQGRQSRSPRPPRPGANRRRRAKDQHKAHPGQAEAEAFGGILAQRHRIQSPPQCQQQRHSGKDQRRGQPDMREGAVRQRAHHPVNDLGGGKGLGERLRTSELAAPASAEIATPARISASAPPRGPARSQHQRRGNPRPRQRRQRQPARKPPQARSARPAPWRRRGGDADQPRLGQRVAQEALHRRARKPERRADQQAQNGARQPDLLHHLHNRPALARQQRAPRGFRQGQARRGRSAARRRTARGRAPKAQAAKGGRAVFSLRRPGGGQRVTRGPHAGHRPQDMRRATDPVGIAGRHHRALPATAPGAGCVSTSSGALRRSDRVLRSPQDRDRP